MGGEWPLYRRISDELCRQIERGDYAPGEKLPREADLATEFDTTVPTVRKALAPLREQGVIRSLNGVGSFVQYRPGVQSVELPRNALPVRRSPPPPGAGSVMAMEFPGSRNVLAPLDGDTGLRETRTTEEVQLHPALVADVEGWTNSAEGHLRVSRTEATVWTGSVIEQQSVTYEHPLDVQHAEGDGAITVQRIVRVVRAGEVADLPSLGRPDRAPLLEVRVVERFDDGQVARVGYHRYLPESTTLVVPDSAPPA